MNRFNNYTYFAISIFTTVTVLIAAAFFIAAYCWEVVGFGLNPLIALPMSGVFLTLAPVVAERLDLIDSYEQDLEDLENGK